MTATSMAALDLLDDLVRIDSVNPGLDPAGAGEAAVVTEPTERQASTAPRWRHPRPPPSSRR